jgi:hypothetical protein
MLESSQLGSNLEYNDDENTLKTLDDFETIIFPVVGEFLRDNGTASQSTHCSHIVGSEEGEIETKIMDCVALYKKASFGKYGDLFVYMEKNIFKDATTIPDSIKRYFDHYLPKV